MATVLVSAGSDVEPLPHAAEAQAGRRIVAACVVAVVVIEAAGLSAGATVAAAGYAALILILVNYVAFRLRRGSGAGAVVAPAAMLLVPFVLRLVALTLEDGPVPVARHYALIGAAAATALVCAAVSFPELRPRLELTVRHPGQLLVALSGLVIGLVGAVALGRGHVVPLRGSWRSPGALLVLAVGAALTEELLFRGFLQTAFSRLVGKLAPIAGTAALLLVYLGVRPVWVVVAAVLLGFASAVVVESSGRFEGVVAGRFLLYAGMFVIWPAVFHLH
jgi:membrane protease YdiL (CAAX protease family)